MTGVMEGVCVSVMGNVSVGVLALFHVCGPTGQPVGPLLLLAELPMVSRRQHHSNSNNNYVHCPHCSHEIYYGRTPTSICIRPLHKPR